MNPNSITLTWERKTGLQIKTDILTKISDISGINTKDIKKILIYGDNNKGLRLLYEEYSKRIKCVYLDPPYNSLLQYEHYLDSYTHEDWLNMMNECLRLIHPLISGNGFVFVQIDNRELHYLKVLMDEIFGRDNYRNSFIVHKPFDKFANKNYNTSYPTSYDTILLYTKEASTRLPILSRETLPNEKIGLWKNFLHTRNNEGNVYPLFGITPQKSEWCWSEKDAQKAILNYEALLEFANVAGLPVADFDNVYRKYIDEYGISSSDFQVVRHLNRKVEYYICPANTVYIGDDWTDITVTGNKTSFEHEVNEMLLSRIISHFTNQDEIILDAFLGSGTTAVVAEKYNRNWIGIEKGEHCLTQCVPRINKEIEKLAVNNASVGNPLSVSCGYIFLDITGESK
jgi:adenine-specific DNA-methyltransferase